MSKSALLWCLVFFGFSNSAHAAMGSQPQPWEMYNSESWSFLLPADGLAVAKQTNETSFLLLPDRSSSVRLLSDLKGVKKFSFLVQQLTASQSETNTTVQLKKLHDTTALILQKEEMVISYESEILSTQLSDGTKGCYFWLQYVGADDCGIHVRLAVNDELSQTWIISAFLNVDKANVALLNPDSVIVNTLIEHILSFSFSKTLEQDKRLRHAYRILQTRPEDDPSAPTNPSTPSQSSKEKAKDKPELDNQGGIGVGP